MEYSRVGHFLQLVSEQSEDLSKDVCLNLLRDFLIVNHAFNVSNEGRRASFPPYAFVLGRLLHKQGIHLVNNVRRAPAKEAHLQQVWAQLAAVDRRLL